jgi:hypothetical protein
MNRTLNFVAAILVIVFGTALVVAIPYPVITIFSMTMISLAILSLTLQIYFPPKAEKVSEPRVVRPKRRAAQAKKKSRKSRRK